MDTQGVRKEIRRRHDHGDDHLMCRTSLWGVAATAGCGYFAWVSFEHVLRNELEWPHDLWTAATYLVWIVLLSVLALDTRCLRERVFFSTLSLNFVIGLSLTLWSKIPSTDVRIARLATGALWALGAILGLTTVGQAGKIRPES
jgi:hypothetical protein